MRAGPVPRCLPTSRRSPATSSRVRHAAVPRRGGRPPATAATTTLVRLSCLDDDAQGEPLEVLWESGAGRASRSTGEAWERVAERGFDPPKLFSAYLHTLRWNCVTATDPNLFQAPFRAGIKIDAYQLEPLRKALLPAAGEPVHRRRRRASARRSRPG